MDGASGIGAANEANADVVAASCVLQSNPSKRIPNYVVRLLKMRR